MRSGFQNSTRRRGNVGSTPKLDEVYDLRGLNLSDPDQVTEEGESPRADNCRMYARQDQEKRVAIRTRKGSRRLSTPVGEALNDQNASARATDNNVTDQNWLYEQFTPSSTGVLTRLLLDIKRSVAGSGHVIVEIYTNVAGVPTTRLAQGSILASAITGAYQDLPAYFIDAPTLTNGTVYWWRARVQTGGTATYQIGASTGSGAYSSVTPGTILTNLSRKLRYKSYLSTAGTIKGFTRRYPSNGQNRTLFAFGTNMYSGTDAGVASSISTAISALATKVRFDQTEDYTLWCDGNNTAKKWDGTTVTDMAGAPTAPKLLIMHQNRAFFVPAADPTRVEFTDLGTTETKASTNFFYVPSPKSPDHITGWKVFQDNLVIFTYETKHVLYGSDLGSFTRKQAIGTKGCVSDEAMAVDRNYIYFMGDDKMIYRYNGVEDELLSEKVEPELSSITDTESVRFHLYRNQLRVYYKKGTDATERMLLLELSKKESNKYLQWFQDTGREIIGSLEWTHSNNELIEFSSKVGAYYLGETDDSDLGKAIAFKYWTKYKLYGSGMAKDRVKRFRPFVRPSDAPYILQVGKDIDFNNDPVMVPFTVDAGGATWGSFTWGDGTIWGDNAQLVDDKVAMSGRGKFTQYRFENELVESPVDLYGYGALIKSGRAR
jgi:hypothetical protein